MLDRVTVTGADDTTNPNDLVTIAARYPFVEFGILVSKNNLGLPRFPSRQWMHDLRNTMDSDPRNRVPLSIHLCGKIVRDVYMGDWVEAVDLMWPLWERFSRIQINTHGIKHEHDELAMELGVRSMLRRGVSVIMQKDNANDATLTSLLSLNREGNVGRVDVLYDLSHGAGLLPSEWPLPIKDAYCGYAGGLSPDNLQEQLKRIDAVVPEPTKYWIDAETHLRNVERGTDYFDLGLVTAFLNLANQHMTAK